MRISPFSKWSKGYLFQYFMALIQQQKSRFPGQQSSNPRISKQGLAISKSTKIVPRFQGRGGGRVPRNKLRSLFLVKEKLDRPIFGGKYPKFTGIRSAFKSFPNFGAFEYFKTTYPNQLQI